jgi:prephenate dehydrogenase
MDEDGFLRASRVAIWGLGLMGGSLALALKGKCQALVGIDTDPAAVELAQAEGIVDEASTQPSELLPEADVVVLATPVRTILRLLAELPRLHPGPAVVIDLGSTKRAVLAAMEALPERFDPLGGHPMCGKEKASLRYAEAAIYLDATFALAALPRSTARARALGVELVRAAGACPLWIEAGEHDRWVAATSHTPYLVASALVQATHEETAPLVGPGFRSTSRLAGSSAVMMVDILATNAEYIGGALGAVRERIERMEALLAAGEFEQLAEMLEAGREQYLRLVK